VQGSPWSAGGVLPSGKTEAGTWSAGPLEGIHVQPVPISYSIPLSSAIALRNIHFLRPKEAATTECPGSPKNPTAAPGNLCIYATVLAEEFEYVPLDGLPETFISGAVVSFYHEASSVVGGDADFDLGTWAVTAQ
jgi:hypothetical protein